MENTFVSGDIVKSVAGRDKGNYFIVVKTERNFAYISDGKIHKVDSLKKKNVKHLELVYREGAKSLSDRIVKGEFVGNGRIKKFVSKILKEE